MKYELRTLTSKDIFPLSKIISKIGISEFKNAISPENLIALGKGNEAAIGLNIAIEGAGIILEHLPNCEKEIYAFLADLTGAKVEDLKNDSMAEFAEIIIELVKKEEFKDFTRVASKLFR